MAPVPKSVVYIQHEVASEGHTQIEMGGKRKDKGDNNITELLSKTDTY